MHDRDGFIWYDGQLVPWRSATTHVLTHSLHYGVAVFEGLRAYATPGGPAIFRLREHMERLKTSARLIHMEIPYSVDELCEATRELVAVNGLPSSYIRPIAFYGFKELGVPPRDNPVEVAIMSWPWGSYLGDEAMKKGVRAKISSWTRMPSTVIPHAAKATGIYLNSMLAVIEAQKGGYEEAIFLTEHGFIADCSGENIFVVKDGVIYTPGLDTGILHGITRDTIIQMAADLGYTVVEKTLIRSDLYVADELFMTGTAAEVTPVRSVDDYEVGDPGPVTLAIQKTYLDTVQGLNERWSQWLDVVPARQATA
jgi:branched-chain amino acid aminotransferase